MLPKRTTLIQTDSEKKLGCEFYRKCLHCLPLLRRLNLVSQKPGGQLWTKDTTDLTH